MIRHLQNILPVSTSHGVGRKRVLLSANESGCSLTQIAVTTLVAGETAVAHIHPDMQEGFFVLEGRLEVTLDGQKTICEKDTFVYVERCTTHEMFAVTDCRIMTIGCVIEAGRDKYYPMLFKQNRKALVWGTEDWTVSCVPGSESEIENGTWARYKLNDVIARHPSEILGKQTAVQYHNLMPLLTKIIDTQRDLSIQVHPNNEMAQRLHGKMGKSEMWYILDAAPKAYLYAGFKTAITADEYKQRVAEGTITDVLAKHYVKSGDVFYLPAGRVHAIGAGIRLAEVQQSSDVTYRIFDYNRPGLDGKPRELHTELAAQAIDYTVYPEYRTENDAKSGANQLLNTPYFSINVVETAQAVRRNLVKYDSFVILMNLGGECRIRIHATGNEIILPANQSCLIPACIADYAIEPIESTARVLETFINNRKSFGQIVSDFLRWN